MNAILAEQLAHLAEKIAFISEVLPPDGEPCLAHFEGARLVLDDVAAELERLRDEVRSDIRKPEDR